MKEKNYNRAKAKEYAKKWAYLRNPKYYNYDPVGGDCTNFISQCIFAGDAVMNYNKNDGWFYIDGNNKSPSWSGVEYLYNFLVNNKEIGPFGKECSIDDLEEGDIIQLSFDGIKFSHSLLVIKILEKNLDNIYIATHTYDAYNKKISSYNYKKIRFIHIEKIRQWN